MTIVRRMVAVAGAAAVLAGLVTGVVPASASMGGAAPTAAPTKVYKACADKQTGAIRLVVQGRKCRKSEIRMRWNVQGPAGIAGPVGPAGPTGAQGIPGPALTVKDGNGTVLGQFLSLAPGPINMWTVLFEGGAYLYLGVQTGPGVDRRLPLGAVSYLDNTCAGTPYYNMPGTYQDIGVGGPERILQAFSDGSAAAFAYSGGASTTLAVATPAWTKNPAKACVAAAALAAGTKIQPLTPVTPPPFAVGHIHIG